MTTAGSQVVNALEACYAAVQRKHPDLPDNVLFVLGHGARRGSIVWGHFAAGRWVDRGDAEQGEVFEIMVSSENLARGGELVFTTVVHESVHALAKARGVKETSRQGRYHNRKFVNLAEELGMTYPHEGPDSRIGWSAVVLTAESVETYAETIDALDQAILVAAADGLLPTEGDEPTKKKRKAVVVQFDDDFEEVEMSLSLYDKLQARLPEHTMEVIER